MYTHALLSAKNHDQHKKKKKTVAIWILRQCFWLSLAASSSPASQSCSSACSDGTPAESGEVVRREAAGLARPQDLRGRRTARTGLKKDLDWTPRITSEGFRGRQGWKKDASRSPALEEARRPRARIQGPALRCAGSGHQRLLLRLHGQGLPEHASRASLPRRPAPSHRPGGGRRGDGEACNEQACPGHAEERNGRQRRVRQAGGAGRAAVRQLLVRAAPALLLDGPAVCGPWRRR